MLEIIRKLLIGHSHKWKIIQTFGVIGEHGYRKGTMYHLQCEVCGNVKAQQENSN